MSGDGEGSAEEPFDLGSFEGASSDDSFEEVVAEFIDEFEGEVDEAFVEVVEVAEFIDVVETDIVVIGALGETGDGLGSGVAGPGSGPGGPVRRNLLRQSTVPMTAFAQDPDTDDGAALLTRLPVPADRLQRGPRNHRFHVVDFSTATREASPPVVLHSGDSWTYVDRWAGVVDTDALVGDREFRAQNVFAVASHTLAIFERHLGRPIPWRSGMPHLYLVPEAMLKANARYSPKHAGVLFGWVPARGAEPAVYTCLSYDVIVHEVTHAILDGLRPRYTEPGLPDQLAFHEALADLVALFSVFDLDGAAIRYLGADTSGRVTFPTDAEVERLDDPGERRAALRDGRAAYLKSTPLAGLAEQLGRRRARRQRSGDGTASAALRRSVEMPVGEQWRPLTEPHQRAEVLVAAFMQTFVTIWAGRLDEFRPDGGLDASRVAEEGTKSARHLLGMLLRSLDYLPPVELEFADVVDSVITADKRLAPDDDHDYRGALERSFASFGITAPPHRIVDEDGVAAPREDANEPEPASYPPDPDAQTQKLGFRYEHLNFVALRTSPDEVFQFIWNNATLLGLDVRLTTKVERVLSSSRVGPDGMIVNEVLAEYTQRLRTTAGELPAGIDMPTGMDPNATVELWGGGVLVFDQFGRYRLHQRKPILDSDRQSRRLQHLFDTGKRDSRGGYGTTDGVSEGERFAMLHDDSSDGGW